MGILLLVLAAAAAAQTTPARDTTPSAATGIIRGRVVAAADGRPLHRVRVTVNTQMPNPPSGVTDTRGIFEIAGVPAGAYSLTAARAGYLTIQYGQRRPREAGRTVDVRGGETLEGIEIALYRGGVLAGRVLDEIGEPCPGARVEAIDHRYIRGRRVPVAARITTTNDAGEFRLSGLDPGAYQIRASSTEVWEGDDGKETYVFAVTYFPGVKERDEPQTIPVALGQEVAGLEFRLIAGRAARVTGVLEDANGQPIAGQVVNMDRITRTIGGALQSAGFGGRTKSDARGAFELTKLAAGEYQIYSGTESDRVGVQAVVNDGEVKHVVVAPRKPTAIAGTVVTDEGAPPPFPPTAARVIPIQVDAESVLPVWAAPRESLPSSNWSFRIARAEGQYLFRMTGLPQEWMLKRVLLDGRDITDVPLPIVRGAPDVERLQVVISRTGARVAGDVVDRAGAPFPDATIVVFAENRALWGPGSRFIKAARPDDKGRFTIAGLPSGVYRAIARDFVIDGQWEDPAFLDSLVREAVRIELTEGSTATIQLTAGGRP